MSTLHDLLGAPEDTTPEELERLARERHAQAPTAHTPGGDTPAPPAPTDPGPPSSLPGVPSPSDPDDPYPDVTTADLFRSPKGETPEALARRTEEIKSRLNDPARAQIERDAAIRRSPVRITGTDVPFPRLPKGFEDLPIPKAAAQAHAMEQQALKAEAAGDAELAELYWQEVAALNAEAAHLDAGSVAAFMEAQRAFEAATVLLDNGERVYRKGYESMSPGEQAQLNELGLDAYNEAVEQATVVLDNGERVDRERYEAMDPVEQAQLNELGFDAYNEAVEQATVVLDNGERVDRERYEAMDPVEQARLNELGFDAYIEAATVLLDSGERVDRERYESLGPKAQRRLNELGLDAYNAPQESGVDFTPLLIRTYDAHKQAAQEAMAFTEAMTLQTAEEAEAALERAKVRLEYYQRARTAAATDILDLADLQRRESALQSSRKTRDAEGDQALAELALQRARALPPSVAKELAKEGPAEAARLINQGADLQAESAAEVALLSARAFREGGLDAAEVIVPGFWALRQVNSRGGFEGMSWGAIALNSALDVVQLATLGASTSVRAGARGLLRAAVTDLPLDELSRAQQAQLRSLASAATSTDVRAGARGLLRTAFTDLPLDELSRAQQAQIGALASGAARRTIAALRLPETGATMATMPVEAQRLAEIELTRAFGRLLVGGAARSSELIRSGGRAITDFGRRVGNDALAGRGALFGEHAQALADAARLDLLRATQDAALAEAGAIIGKPAHIRRLVELQQEVDRARDTLLRGLRDSRSRPVEPRGKGGGTAVAAPDDAAAAAVREASVITEVSRIIEEASRAKRAIAPPPPAPVPRQGPAKAPAEAAKPAPKKKQAQSPRERSRPAPAATEEITRAITPSRGDAPWPYVLVPRRGPIEAPDLAPSRIPRLDDPSLATATRVQLQPTVTPGEGPEPAIKLTPRPLEDPDDAVIVDEAVKHFPKPRGRRLRIGVRKRQLVGIERAKARAKRKHYPSIAAWQHAEDSKGPLYVVADVNTGAFEYLRKDPGVRQPGTPEESYTLLARDSDPPSQREIDMGPLTATIGEGISLRRRRRR